MPTPHLQEQLPGPLGKLLVSLSSLSCVAFRRSQRRKKGQCPNPRRPWDRSEQHQANPPQSARFDEVGVAGSNRVAVDALRRDLLPLTPLQGLVNAHNQRRSFGYEYLHEQPQQDAARFPTRPVGAAQYPMVAAEAPFVLQTHRSQGAGHGSFPRSEDRAGDQHLDMSPNTFGEKWVLRCFWCSEMILTVLGNTIQNIARDEPSRDLDDAEK